MLLAPDLVELISEGRQGPQVNLTQPRLRRSRLGGSAPGDRRPGVVGPYRHSLGPWTGRRDIPFAVIRPRGLAVWRDEQKTVKAGTRDVGGPSGRSVDREVIQLIPLGQAASRPVLCRAPPAHHVGRGVSGFRLSGKPWDWRFTSLRGPDRMPLDSGQSQLLWSEIIIGA
jgi:hypothetical protein